MLKMDVTVTPPFGKFEYKVVGQAMHETGVMLEAMLKAALTGTTFPGMTREVVDKDLASGVQRHDYGLFEFEVTAPDLESVEKATQPYDMKPGLLHGPRHRVNKEGKPYTIVPFRHKKESLPAGIRAMANRMTLSRVIGQYMEVRSDDGAQILRNTYQWGDQLPNERANSLLNLTVSQTGYVHKYTKTSGLVKMKGAGYMTFRTVSTHSDPASWWNPGKPENPIVDSVWEFARPLVEARIAQAWSQVVDG